MKLLQTEIDIVPGRKAQKQPLAEGMVGQGTTVVRITNNTTQENAYKVQLSCDNPYWQDTWYTIAPLPPTGSSTNAPAPGKQDQVAQNGRVATVHITRGGERDVMIIFNVPRKHDSRAGLYQLTVQVETRVVGQAAGLRRKDRFTALQALAIIRPFEPFDAWRVEFQPETRKVGFFKRAADYEAVITNECNDWLYCELRVPRPKDVLVQTPVVRVAVPPPEPGQERSVRTAPIRGISRVRPFRGEKLPLPLPVTTARLAVPSVAPLPEEALYAPASANCHAAVVEADTQDMRLPPSEQALVYSPPFPATLSGCLGAIAQNGKGLIMTLIGLIVAANLAVFMFEQLFRHNIVAEPFRTQVAPGGVLTMGGRWIKGARIYIDNDTQPAELAQAPEERGARNFFANTLRAVHPSHLQLVGVKIPETYDGKRIRLTVQRAGALPFLGPLLPKYKCGGIVQVGNPPKAPEPPKKAYAFVTPTVAKGQQFAISGSSLGSSGQVMLGSESARVVRWTPARIVASPPAGVAINEPIPVNVIPKDRDPISAGTIKIVDPTAAGAGGAGAAPAPGQAGAPSGSGASSGGAATPAPAAGGGATPRAPRTPQTRPTAGGGASTASRNAASSAYAALLRGDATQTSTFVNRALQANANDPLALAVKGYALLRDEKPGDAAGPIGQAIRLTSGGSGRARAVALTASGWLSEMRQDPTSAERQYRSALEADKTCVLAAYGFAYFLVDANRRMEAIEQVRAALRSNPTEARASPRFMDLAKTLGVR